MINVILIIALVALIIYIISKRKDNDSWFDGFLDALFISDIIDLIGVLIRGIGNTINDWTGGGGSFSGGGSSGSWELDFDFDD